VTLPDRSCTSEDEVFNSETDIQNLKAEQRVRARQTLQNVVQKDQKSFAITEKIRTFVYNQSEFGRSFGGTQASGGQSGADRNSELASNSNTDHGSSADRGPGHNDTSQPNQVYNLAEATIRPGVKRQLICAVFMGLPSEPNLRELIGNPEIQPEISATFWALPKIVGQELKFYICDPNFKLSECLEKNSFGIDEPLTEKSKEVAAAQIDMVFVPGLAFDKSMNRLGRGKAYYDRFLKNFSGLKVGVLFHDQILKENIAVQSHDIKMDWLITENCMYKTTEKKRTA
jgi:5,10-methenyltetrahydrofolate synthetase